MVNSKLIVSTNPEELTVDDAIQVQLDIEEGFVYSLPDTALSHEEWNLIYEDVKKKFGNIREFDYNRGKNNHCVIINGDSIKIYVRGNSQELYGSFLFKTEEGKHLFWDIYCLHAKKSEGIDLYVHTYNNAGGNIIEDSKMMKREELESISDTYYPYIETNIMFEQFFTGNENILLLVGQPGIGKSKLSGLALKYALENSDYLPYDKLEDNPSLDSQFVSAAIVKSNEVLAQDAFWMKLERLSPDFCIIDDLDYMLTKRDAEVKTSDDAVKNAFLNQFLSFTDGVDKRKTKFIITTNQTYTDIDSALLRKGRLFDILELRPLDQTEALNIWESNDLDKEEFFKVFKQHSILPADLGSEISKRLNKRIECATRSYLKESGISKVERAAKGKKVGL